MKAYPDVEKHESEIAGVEKAWPKFHELDQGAADAAVPWGEHKMGRLPPFVWDDGSPNGDTYGACLDACSMAEKEVIYSSLERESRVYAESFNVALQHNQERVQHHIHRRGKDGVRILPSA